MCSSDLVCAMDLTDCPGSMARLTVSACKGKGRITHQVLISAHAKAPATKPSNPFHHLVFK